MDRSRQSRSTTTSPRQQARGASGRRPHRATSQLLAELNGGKIHRAAEIPVYEFGRGFIDAVAAVLPRRAEVSVSITERQLYLDVDGRGFSTAVVEHRIG